MFNFSIEENKHLDSLYVPDFFRLYNTHDQQRFNSLIQSQKDVIYFHDALYTQLTELAKIRNPKRKLTDDDKKELVAQHLNGTDMNHYGVWVYYPWSRKMVHIVDKEEFIELRTASNRNKITTDEQNILSQKKVGVIGLSVGHSVSVTMAMERSCGELRLADFDTLELNNLNRIRTGVHNLGILKVVAVAREIAEIDPFIKVVCYPEGITEDNIHDFYNQGGKLDMVIDECDSVFVKIQCRIKAKELSIPVLMEASDRGTLDVERFDLEPDRPIMHGWLEHLDIDMDFLKTLKTSEEKLPYILPISGLETLSARMKASMIEIEQTLTTWPQLASAVTLGGALTADTCRRIFLDQFADSKRYFIDLEQLIPDSRKKTPHKNTDIEKELTESYMIEMAEKAIAIIPSDKIDLSDAQITEVVQAAIKAPSAGNNQPWKWLLHHGFLFLFHDRIRSVSFGDFQDIASYIALGAAIENLELETNKLGIGVVTHTFPLDKSTKLTAVFQFTQAVTSATLYRPAELIPYIDTRFTNRKLGDRVPLPAQQIQLLSEAVASIPGAQLHIKDTDKDLDLVADIVAASERLRILHTEGHYEFFQKEIRWDFTESITTKDGIDVASVQITPSELVGLKLIKDPEVARLLAEWRAGKALEKLTRKTLAAASAFGVITMPQFSSLDYLMGGRAVERMWLTATELDISMQPMLAPLLHFARLKEGNGEGMADFMKEEFSQLFNDFIQLFPEVAGKAQVFMFRLSKAEMPEVKSYRIPIDKVLLGTHTDILKN
jgi:molybdopterin/thiamine biosynthesis adenylyltransferase